MQTSAAHSEDYLSLVVQNNSVWSEVTTNTSTTILGRTPATVLSNDPHSIFLAGFRGITPSAWIEKNILQPNLSDNCNMRIVDTKEETAEGGIFIQHLKPSRAGAIGPSGAETVLCLYSTNITTLNQLQELSKHISALSNSTIYPITDGLQYLTLRANALSVESEELHDAAALAELSNPSSHSHSDHLSQTATASSLPPPLMNLGLPHPPNTPENKRRPHLPKLPPYLQQKWISPPSLPPLFPMTIEGSLSVNGIILLEEEGI